MQWNSKLNLNHMITYRNTHFSEKGANSRNWIVKCYNIITFLASARDRNFSMGSTIFSLEIYFCMNKTSLCSYYMLMRRNLDPI